MPVNTAFQGGSKETKPIGIPVQRDPLLQEREKTHGDFRNTARVAIELKRIFRVEGGFTGKPTPGIDARKAEALDMIATKIARIVTGDSTCRDHWDDIVGYAKLGSEACE